MVEQINALFGGKTRAHLGFEAQQRRSLAEFSRQQAEIDRQASGIAGSRGKGLLTFIRSNLQDKLGSARPSA